MIIPTINNTDELMIVMMHPYWYLCLYYLLSISLMVIVLGVLRLIKLKMKLKL